MKELYWITRLDGLCTLFGVLIGISGFAIICTLLYIVETLDTHGEVNWKKVRTSLTISGLCFIVSFIAEVLTPSTEQAYLIYGVGGTIDYLKNNPTAKQLPDKCIKALDKWIDTQLNGSEILVGTSMNVDEE